MSSDPLSSDQLKTLAEGGAPTTFVYDTLGNLTSEPLTRLTSRTLEYDGADRLVKVTPATGSAATFAFDGYCDHAVQWGETWLRANGY